MLFEFIDVYLIIENKYLDNNLFYWLIWDKNGYKWVYIKWSDLIDWDNEKVN